jgi:hypothetical protein
MMCQLGENPMFDGLRWFGCIPTSCAAWFLTDARNKVQVILQGLPENVKETETEKCPRTTKPRAL